MNYNDQVADLDRAVAKQQERDRSGKFTSGNSSWANNSPKGYAQDDSAKPAPNSELLQDEPFVIEGSITGAVVRSTIQFRQGRSLLYPGVRVFDHVTPKIATKTKQSE